MKKAVFLDRDGTLIKEKNYLKNPDNIEWFNGVREGLENLQSAGYFLILITNQSGVARGMMTEEDVNLIHERMQNYLSKQEIELDDIFYCPYLKNGNVEEYSRESKLRKPEPGMINRAAREMDIDKSKSYLIGDKISDLKAGYNAGCKTILLRTGYGKESEQELHEKLDYYPDLIDDTFEDAVRWILKRANKKT